MTDKPLLRTAGRPVAASSGRTNAAAQPEGAGAFGVVVVTGMSGAGRTATLKALEDLGYEAVDNLPLSLLPNLVGAGPTRPLAIGVDIRTRDFGVEPVLDILERLLRECRCGVRLAFIDCDDEVLSRRYTETRHRHPLAVDRPLIDGIHHERRLIAPLRGRADVVIDTTHLALGELKRVVEGHFAIDERHGLTVFITSFAYRGGLPREADLVFDARFLRNPHYEPDLRPLTGRDRRVVEFVASDADFVQFFDRLGDLVEGLLPRFAVEGKSYLTIAIGCTGGRHRSVVVAEKLADRLREAGRRVDLRHRELEDGGA